MVDGMFPGYHSFFGERSASLSREEQLFTFALCTVSLFVYIRSQLGSPPRQLFRQKRDMRLNFPAADEVSVVLSFQGRPIDAFPLLAQYLTLHPTTIQTHYDST